MYQVTVDAANITANVSIECNLDEKSMDPAWLPRQMDVRYIRVAKILQRVGERQVQSQVASAPQVPGSLDWRISDRHKRGWPRKEGELCCDQR